MDKKVIETAISLSQKYTLSDFDSFNISHPQSVLTRIMFVCMSFDQNEELANSILISLIPEADIDELVIIFNRITLYSEEFIRYCKEYSKIRRLKPIITKIFKKLKINYEDAYIFTTENIEESSIKKLFETINTADFKKTKEITAKLIEKHKDLLPNLSETGYRNIRQIGKIHIFENEYCFNHPSEILRIEYFKGIKSFTDIYTFLFFNQFIYESDHRLEIRNCLDQKLLKLKNEVYFDAYIDILYNGIVIKMCKSKNTIRRHLGVIILKCLLCYIKNDIDKEMITDLIYDVNSEIRRDAADLRHHVKFDFQKHFMKLLSHNYEEIYGACIFLSDVDEEVILNNLMKYYKATIEITDVENECINNIDNDTDENDTSDVEKETVSLGSSISFDENDLLLFSSESQIDCLNNHKASNDSINYEIIDCDLIYGMMCCLNNISCINPILTSIVDQLYQKHSNLSSKYSWRILRECCMHYKLIDNHNLLMNILLKTDHLGLIILIRDLIDVSKIDFEDCLKNGIDEIFNRKTTARKSGGISQYFTLLIKNRKNYPVVKDKLFDIIKTYELQVVNEFSECYSETSIFHILNVFHSIFDDYSEDQLFYLKLGFFCLQQSSFSIKNCGFALLGSIFKKILVSQKSFDNLLLSFKNTRHEIEKIMNHAIDNENASMVYFILFIYENTSILKSNEIKLIERSKTMGEFVSLKAESILKKLMNTNSANIDIDQSINEDVHESKTTDYIIDFDLKTLLVAILIDLNSNKTIDPSIMKILDHKFKIKNTSCEFLIHKIIPILKQFNISKDVSNMLLEYSKSKYKEEYDQNLYNSEYDFSFIIDLIDSNS